MPPLSFSRPPWFRLAILGVASGLPLLLTGPTLQAWMKQSGVDLPTIGPLALTGLPYTLKFMWSPLVDRFALPPGRRRGWLLSRWPLQRALFVFGIAQALPCLALWALSRSSAGLSWMLAAVATENLGYGLGMVALTALLMRLCDLGLVATQFALLSSLAALIRVVFASPAEENPD